MTDTDRKICEAFLKGEAAKAGKTQTDGRCITFHGNEIARKTDRGILVTFAGWPTKTTADKINALLRMLRADGRVWVTGPQRTTKDNLKERTIMSTMHGTPPEELDPVRWYRVLNIRTHDVSWTRTLMQPEGKVVFGSL